MFFYGADYAGFVPLHFGKLVHPQNDSPVLRFRRATISKPQFGQLGA